MQFFLRGFFADLQKRLNSRSERDLVEQESIHGGAGLVCVIDDAMLLSLVQQQRRVITLVP
jgi:hypothetical protein